MLTRKGPLNFVVGALVLKVLLEIENQHHDHMPSHSFKEAVLFSVLAENWD
jgi:hypothetical protein